MAHLATSMANIANHHFWDIDITAGECAWLSTEHLKIPPPLSCKLADYFVGLFPVLYAIDPFSF